MSIFHDAARLGMGKNILRRIREEVEPRFKRNGTVAPIEELLANVRRIIREEMENE